MNLADTLKVPCGSSGGVGANSSGASPATRHITSDGFTSFSANARAALRQPSKSVSLSRVVWCMFLLLAMMSKPKSQLSRLRLESFRQPCAIEQMRRGAVIAEHDERQRLLMGDMQPHQVGQADRGQAARGDDAIDGP